jgi:fido (protein-threonine AMPylation protein)
MQNRLGIQNEKKIKEIEYYLFNLKYHIIDENYVFNEEDIFNVNYLEKIHIFLFNDIYEYEDCKIRPEINKETIEEINKNLKEIKNIIYFYDSKVLRKKIYYLWKNQLFYDGNTRTILCYLKILSKAFNFEINYDFTKDINKDYFINELLDKIYEEKVKKNKSYIFLYKEKFLFNK